MIREEIKMLFSNSDVDSAYSVESVGNIFPAYVVRFVDNVGVAVPYGGGEVKEEFANASLHSGSLLINDVKIPCLFLLSSIECTRNEFAVFCEDFVDPGTDGVKRLDLLANPVNWWRNWRQLIGNAITEKKPYAVIGELLVYKFLLSKGYSVDWSGPKSSSHDLICTNEEFEVKSTTKRYDKIIHISGQFQLQKEKELSLIFCRFEPNVNGVSINDVVDVLVNEFGEPKDELNAKLSLLGYGSGASVRNEKYQLHEALKYKIDDCFPQITPDKFVCGKLPDAITQLEYDVNLSSLESVALDLQ